MTYNVPFTCHGTDEDGSTTAYEWRSSIDDVLKLKEMGADIAGVRGAVCTNGDRMNGSISKEKVRELVSLIK